LNSGLWVVVLLGISVSILSETELTFH